MFKPRQPLSLHFLSDRWINLNLDAKTLGLNFHERYTILLLWHVNYVFLLVSLQQCSVKICIDVRETWSRLENPAQNWNCVYAEEGAWSLSVNNLIGIWTQFSTLAYFVNFYPQKLGCSFCLLRWNCDFTVPLLHTGGTKMVKGSWVFFKVNSCIKGCSNLHNYLIYFKTYRCFV